MLEHCSSAASSPIPSSSSRPVSSDMAMFESPRQVPTPEPHLPLRKASPHLLQARKGAPHPLVVNGQNGIQGFRPATGGSVAMPYHTPAVVERGGLLDPGQDERKHSFETIVPLGHAENGRKETWPAESSGFSWDTGSRPPPPPHGLRQSRSMSSGLRGLRDRLTKHKGMGAARPFSPELDTADDVRTSFRSALTSSSSFMDSTVSTERSSTATGNSSTSDFVHVYPSWPEGRDDDLTVEDAIGMYADGFDTPSKQSLDAGGDQALRPSMSPPAGYGRGGHRRSHSATWARPPPPPDALTADLAPPRPSHVRTSTQILAGTDLDPAQADSQAAKAIPRDRYGFKKVSHHVTLDRFDAWEGPYDAYIERRTVKWKALMKKYGLGIDKPVRFPPKSDKVKRYVRKGIPPEWRGAAWFWYAGGPGLQKNSEGQYLKLLDRIKKGGALSDTDREHIERDLNRTFPDNVRFKPDPIAEAQRLASDGIRHDSQQPDVKIIQSLRRVLQAFAVHNPNIGYCQSLNFIAGLLLLFLDEDEEKTFVLLNVITTDYLPGTHGVSLEGANIDIAVLMTSIKEMLPTIWVKLDDKPANSVVGGPPALPTVSLATTAWFMSLFVGTLPIESVLRVWDCLFLEGPKILFRFALAIFKAGEDQIQAVNDPMEIFQVVQGMPRAMVDVNGLIDVCFKKGRNGFGGLTQELIEKRREEKKIESRQGRSMTANVVVGKKRLGTIKGRLRSKTKLAA